MNFNIIAVVIIVTWDLLALLMKTPTMNNTYNNNNFDKCVYAEA